MEFNAALHVLAFSNFEGFCADRESARAIVAGFEEIDRQVVPAVQWTHMFSPRHLLGGRGYREAGDEFIEYLHRLQKRKPRTEVGLHLHCFTDVIASLGVRPRLTPSASADPEDCTAPPGTAQSGYDVLLTGYSQEERERLIVGCTEAFLMAGLARPRTFCAGYSAADPAMQALLESCEFTTSFAAQILPRGVNGLSYPPCWYELLEWGENLSPLTGPYRVRRESILPGAAGPYLDRMVEIPLNTDTDVRPPYLHGRPVSRKTILDLHRDRAGKGGVNTCVSLGLHDVSLVDGKTRVAVVDEMISNLSFAAQIGRTDDVEVVFGTASEVSQHVYSLPHLWPAPGSSVEESPNG